MTVALRIYRKTSDSVLSTFSHGLHLHYSSHMTTMSFITWSFCKLVKSLIMFKENPKIRLTLGSSLHWRERYKISQLQQPLD